MIDTAINALPAVPFLVLDSKEGARLIGTKCARCGSVFPGDRTVCANCMARDGMQRIRLSEKGTLYSFTIVHRSFPGIVTPFIAVVIDLDGGGSLKGTLIEAEPAADALRFDMPVKVVYRDTGQRSASGQPFISYYFVPDMNGGTDS